MQFSIQQMQEKYIQGISECWKMYHKLLLSTFKLQVEMLQTILSAGIDRICLFQVTRFISRQNFFEASEMSAK